jgi:hypothetical protein
LIANVDRQILHPTRHRGGEAVDRRSGSEHRLQIRGGQCGGIEGAEAFAQRQPSGKRLGNRHLLVEHEADQQRQRITGDQRVGLVRVREMEAIGQGPMITRARAGETIE